MNNSMIDDFLYKAKIMDTGEWIEGFVIKKQEFFYSPSSTSVGRGGII